MPESVTPVDVRSKLPKMLSPSRAKDYMQCPQLFAYKTIDKLRDPSTIHTAKGSIAHEAFEKIFDHPRGERTPELAVSYVRPAWEELRVQDGYEALVAEGPEFEEDLIAQAEEAVRGWFGVEDPNRWDPVGREVRVRAKLLGVTMHGWIDRLDILPNPNGGPPRVYIGDYKTGKVPRPQYQDEAFFQLEVYAAAFEEMFGVTPIELRLIYTAKGEVLRRPVTPEMMRAVRKKADRVWRSIQDNARTNTWPTKTGPLCPYCHFQPMCPAWNDGSDGLAVAS